MRSSEFKLLVLPHSTRLYRLAYGMLGKREEAEDTVQEVFLKLWKMREGLHQYNSIEALCVRMTRNFCLDILRKRKTNHAFEKQFEKGEKERASDPEEIYEQNEKAAVMTRLINQLPEPQRSLVHFRHIEGKEYHEISELMDMNENAIRVSISRARKQLREMLEKQYASWTN